MFLQVEALVGKRKRFFGYLKKTHEEGGFWLNCVQLTRQVGVLVWVSVFIFFPCFCLSTFRRGKFPFFICQPSEEACFRLVFVSLQKKFFFPFLFINLQKRRVSVFVYQPLQEACFRFSAFRRGVFPFFCRVSFQKRLFVLPFVRCAITQNVRQNITQDVPHSPLEPFSESIRR